eukprot:5308622-Prymnesium_polylepis.1
MPRPATGGACTSCPRCCGTWSGSMNVPPVARAPHRRIQSLLPLCLQRVQPQRAALRLATLVRAGRACAFEQRLAE